MTASPLPYDPNAAMAVVDIGNSACHFARWEQHAVTAQATVAHGRGGSLEQAFDALLATFPAERPPAVVVSSVVPESLTLVEALVDDRLGREALVVGKQLPYPIDVTGSVRQTAGTDRVCAAAAAFHQLQAACAVVDFGTAVTVDLVDPDGVLVGGAILPGLALQLRVLHEYTAQLPEVQSGLPETPYGQDTVEAIQTGVCRGLAGAVRELVEGYATALNQWPQVVATGGDLVFMAPLCPFLDSLVPDLTLRGVGLALARRLEEQGA